MDKIKTPACRTGRQNSKLKILKQGPKFLLSGFVFLLLISHFPFHCFAAPDRIVAIVNDDIVTSKDLNDFTNFMRMQYGRQYKGEELENKLSSLKQDLLQKLIEDRLILQEAKNRKIMIDENRVKASINDIKRRYPSEAEFQNDLDKDGLVQADIEKKIREQLLSYAVVQIEVDDKIRISPEEVTQYYETHKDKLRVPEQREVTLIKLENSNQANTFLYNLRRGEKIESLAARYPITMDKIYITLGEGAFKKEIEDAVAGLKVTEVSDPIKVEDKYFLFRLGNIIPPKEKSLAQAREEINDILSQAKRESGLLKFIDELKKKSYIKIVSD